MKKIIICAIFLICAGVAVAGAWCPPPNNDIVEAIRKTMKDKGEKFSLGDIITIKNKLKFPNEEINYKIASITPSLTIDEFKAFINRKGYDNVKKVEEENNTCKVKLWSQEKMIEDHINNHIDNLEKEYILVAKNNIDTFFDEPDKTKFHEMYAQKIKDLNKKIE